jgi:hypothetical protein
MRTRLISGLALAVFAAACGVINDEPPDMQVFRESRPLGEIKPLAVQVNYDVGRMEISRSLDENLFSIDLEYDRNRANPRLDFNGNELNFELDTRSLNVGSGGMGRSNNLALRLSDKVPLDLDIDTGVSDARLDLGGLRIRSISLEGGVGKTEMTFDKAVSEPVKEIRAESGVGELIIRGLGYSRVERFNFDGGIGRTEIDFTGDLGASRIEASIEVGVGQVKLVLPREADIEIQAEGSFLSNVSAPSFERTGRQRDLQRNETFTHSSGMPNSPKIFIRIESGIGGVAIELL